MNKKKKKKKEREKERKIVVITVFYLFGHLIVKTIKYLLQKYNKKQKWTKCVIK